MQITENSKKTCFDFAYSYLWVEHGTWSCHCHNECDCEYKLQYDDKLLNVAAPVSRPVAINEPNPDQLAPFYPFFTFLVFLRISRSVDNLLLTYLSDTMHTLLLLLIVYVVYGGFAWRLPLQTLLRVEY